MRILILFPPDYPPDPDDIVADLSGWYAQCYKYTEAEAKSHPHPNAYGVSFERVACGPDHYVYKVVGTQDVRFGMVSYHTYPIGQVEANTLANKIAAFECDTDARPIAGTPNHYVADGPHCTMIAFTYGWHTTVQSEFQTFMRYMGFDHKLEAVCDSH